MANDLRIPLAQGRNRSGGQINQSQCVAKCCRSHSHHSSILWTQKPAIDTNYLDDDTMVMVYQSRRPFADLALGLIQGCIQHYGEQVDVEKEDLSDEGRTHVRFTLYRRRREGD